MKDKGEDFESYEGIKVRTLSPIKDDVRTLSPMKDQVRTMSPIKARTLSPMKQANGH